MPPSTRRTPSRRPASRPGASRRSRASSPSTAEPPAPTGPRSRLTGRSAILLLVALVLVISYASSLRAWLQQREDLAEARSQISETTQSIETLQQQKRRYKDDAYVEQQARERFGWVLPGEVGYTVVGADGEPIGDSPALEDTSDGDRPAEQPWYGALWGSVKGAGADPESTPESTEAPGRPDKVIKPKKKDVVEQQDPDRS